MGYPTTIQLVTRNKGNQWYVNFPNALAKAMNFKKGEIVEWEVETINCMKVIRTGKTDKIKARRKTDKSPKES